MRITIVALALASMLTPIAHAQTSDEPPPPPISNRPTSSEPSLFSGRTLGTGEIMVGGGAGWPGLWAIFMFAPSSEINIGVRGGLIYGSPIMGFVPGAGGELQIPLRIHLWGEGQLDFALQITPAIVVGQSSVVGESGAFANDVGWSSRGEVMGLFGFRVMPRVTFLFGGGGHIGFLHAPTSGALFLEGALNATVGLEGLLSRDFMFFGLIDGGAGIVPTRGAGAPLFPPNTGIFRIWVGMAYLL